ncbi:MAG: ABC transporter permease [Clostridiales Family XIII bacterium]|jgi:ribose transport system permease protein|nr:ABC transporter permease [Clostridiales Family XIII bacterium]
MAEPVSLKDGGRLLLRRLGRVENIGVICIMLAFIIVVLVLSGPRFFTSGNLINLFRSVSVTGIVASALTLVMIAGNIDLSVGWLVGLGACITGVYSDRAFLAIFFVLTACALCGTLNGILVGLIRLNPFITTLGTMYFFKGVTMMYSNGRQLTTENPSDVLKAIGAGNIAGIPIPIWIFATVAAVFAFILKKTVFGTRIYAVGANALAARFSGISAVKIVLSAYVLAGLAAGIAGIVLFTKVMSTQPYSGVGLEFDALTAIVLGGVSISGGKGNVIGTILGVLFVGILANGFTLIGLGSNAQYIVQGIILLIAMRADILKSEGKTA